MNGSRDLDGLHGTTNVFALIWGGPGFWIAQISVEQWGAAMGEEVVVRVDGVFHCPWAWKGRTHVSEWV